MKVIAFTASSSRQSINKKLVTYAASLLNGVLLEILEKHEGGVEIESEPGKGTTVTLWLPKISAVDSGEIMPQIETPFSPGG